MPAATTSEKSSDTGIPADKRPADGPKAQPMPAAARIFITIIGLAGLAGLFLTFREWTPELRPRFGLYLLLALISSSMRVSFPGVRGSMSANYVFSMLGLLELTLPE